MSIISPSVQTFPDVALSVWYFDWVESMYNAIGTMYAVGGDWFYPGGFLSPTAGNTWINNLP